MIVQRALKEGPFAMRQLAKDSGLSYAALRAWASGLRTPQPEYLRKLAVGFRRRSQELEKLADQLERAGGEGE
ncbi:hypothetical protein BH23GEM7_BH23GEM7_27210 [soil metagenome]